MRRAARQRRWRAEAQVERWHEQGDEIDALLERPRWRRLHQLLTAGNVEIRVVSRDNAPFLHGKAGVITRTDGTTSSFIGSINESENGWAHSYEMIWEDPSPEAAAWVRSEFDWLWKKGVPLSQAVIDEIGRTADKVEVQVEEMRADPRRECGRRGRAIQCAPPAPSCTCPVASCTCRRPRRHPNTPARPGIRQHQL